MTFYFFAFVFLICFWCWWWGIRGDWWIFCFTLIIYVVIYNHLMIIMRDTKVFFFTKKTPKLCKNIFFRIRFVSYIEIFWMFHQSVLVFFILFHILKIIFNTLRFENWIKLHVKSYSHCLVTKSRKLHKLGLIRCINPSKKEIKLVTSF